MHGHMQGIESSGGVTCGPPPRHEMQSALLSTVPTVSEPAVLTGDCKQPAGITHRLRAAAQRHRTNTYTDVCTSGRTHHIVWGSPGRDSEQGKRERDVNSMIVDQP